MANTRPPSPLAAPKDAEESTRRANAAVLERLPFQDRRDFEDAQRGFIATIKDGIIRDKTGRVVWNLGEYDFLSSEQAPPTVNPSLWRMAQLNRINGLFKVADRLYQVRGFDLANLTIVEGDTGLILIDPLTTCEAAAAALELYYGYRPRLPVKTVIYSHSHVDHFGGVKGVITQEDVRGGRVSIIAPDGFMQAVSGENVLAGTPMSRRAQFQFGALLAKGPRGQVDAGLGKTTARGRITLIAPTELIREPVETRRLDGVEIVFQLAPETEAPAEMHMYFPQFRVLDMAENATRHLHNFCPLRGAVVRDPRMWAHYLAEAMELFGERTDVLIGQHHWPTWGRENILDFLTKQRNLYKHLHDQSLRLMNHGLRPAEVAEALDLPAGLDQDWFLRGYYGTVSHNSKAVYQRYLSWYDGNPANLDVLPPRQSANKTMDYMGGEEKVLERARADYARGEFRWVAQVASQAVFANPASHAARELLADAFEQLGYLAESATWRNAYLYGAQELRNGVIRAPVKNVLTPDLLNAMSLDAFFDFLAVRLNPEKAAGETIRINWHFTDTKEKFAMTLQYSTLTHAPGKTHADADASLALTRATMDAITLRTLSFTEALAKGQVMLEGTAEKLAKLLGMLDEFELMFDVVTPDMGAEAWSPAKPG